MGMEFIAAYAVIEEDKEPNWAAGHAWIETAPVELLVEGYENSTGDFTESEVKLRATPHHWLAELEKDWRGDGFPGAHKITAKSVTFYIAGGSSWGDDPNDEFTVLQNLWNYQDWDREKKCLGPHGSLLRAVGFEA